MLGDRSEYGLLEIKNHLRAFYRSEVHHGRLKRTPGEFVREFKSLKYSTAKTLPTDVEIWLFLFDEYIAWTISLWTFYVIDTKSIDSSSEHRHERISCSVLSGRIVQDLLAVRELIVSGFDPAGRIIARNIAEHIDLLSLFHLDSSAAKEFRLVDDNEKANAFWHRYCAKGRIDKALKRFRAKKQVAKDAAELFDFWREQYWDLIGLSVHPSLPGAVGGTLDGNRLTQNNDTLLDGVLGQVSHMSKFTVHFLILRLYEFVRFFVSDYGTERSEIFCRDNEDDLLKNHVVGTIPILSWIVAAIELPENKETFFPNFETFWRPKLDVTTFNA
jgi:hypothetical protein